MNGGDDVAVDRVLDRAEELASDLAFHLCQARHIHPDLDLDLDVAQVLDDYAAARERQLPTAEPVRGSVDELDRAQIALLVCLARLVRPAKGEELTRERV